MDIFSTLYRFRIIPFLKKWNLLGFMLGAFDILSIILAFQCSYMFNYSLAGGFFFMDWDFLLLFLAVTPVWLLMLYLLNATEIPRTKKFRVLFFEYFLSAATVLLLLIVLYFLFKLYEISRTFIVLIPMFGFIFLVFPSGSRV